MGKMSLEERDLLVAIDKSMMNAEDLLADAGLLATNDRLPRAYTLYQLAMEEIGKAMRIYGSIVLGLLKTAKQKQQFRDDFTNHVEKAQSARTLSLIASEVIKKTNPEFAQQFLSMVLEEYSNPQKLNAYKNYSLYTSWVENSYKTPKEVITQGRVNYIELMAKNRLAVAKAFFKGALTIIDEVKQLAADNPLNEQQLMEQMTEWASKFHNTLNSDPGL
jgi:AbiV family abortive infection protein